MSVNVWQAPNIWSVTGLVITPGSVNSLSIAINPTITFSSILELTPAAVNTLSISINPIVVFGEQIIGTVTAGFAEDKISVKYKILGITVNFKE